MPVSFAVTDRDDLMQILGFGDSSRWKVRVWTQQDLPHGSEPEVLALVLLAALGAIEPPGTQAHCLLKQNFRACVFP